MSDVTQDEAEATCERVLELVAACAPGAEAAARAAVGTTSLTRFANSRIHQNVTEDVRAVTVTVAVEGRVARAMTTRTDADGLAGVVERALAAAALRPADPDFPGFAPPEPVPPVEHWDDATAGATPDRRAEVVAAFVDAGRGVGEAAGYCRTEAVTVALASTAGQRVVGRSSLAELDGIHRAVGPDGQVTDGAAQVTSVRLADLDGAVAGARAAARARAAAEPIELPPGTYPVVLEPRAVAEVLLFPAYLGFNGKAHHEGTSFVHLGEQQWDDAVDIWDDATDPRALGRSFDFEGTPKRRVDLVRAGVSVGLAHDRRSARLAGVEPTGHSVGADAVGGFPTNLFLGGGDRSPEQLVGGLERGLLVTDFWYNRVLDPKTQVVTGLTRNGLFLVEGGEIQAAVQNLRYTQSIVAAFGPGRVLGLGDDAQLAGGREGEGAMHVPSVHLAGWAFTGNARG
ncbi:MAG TPA: metallopeptidase TldD-related protein [Acidimicrobiales bacterium]